jgi:hypothetical protein
LVGLPHQHSDHNHHANGSSQVHFDSHRIREPEPISLGNHYAEPSSPRFTATGASSGGGVAAYRSSRSSMSSPHPGTTFGTSPGPSIPYDANKGSDTKEGQHALYPSRVVLTSEAYLCDPQCTRTVADSTAYPTQAGINPIPISWGAGRKYTNLSRFISINRPSHCPRAWTCCLLSY